MEKNNKRLRLILFVSALCLCAMGAEKLGHPVPSLVENVLAESLVALVFVGAPCSSARDADSSQIDLKEV